MSQLTIDHFFKSHQRLVDTCPTGSIIEIGSDLFSNDDPHTALAHCVSSDLAMGRGIAVQFVRKFGRVQELRKQPHDVGDAPYLIVEDDRLVFYLVTKLRYYQKPTYQSLRTAVIAAGTTMHEKGVRKIAVPLLGCGLDQFDWTRVKTILHEEWVEKRKLHVLYYVMRK